MAIVFQVSMAAIAAFHFLLVVAGSTCTDWTGAGGGGVRLLAARASVVHLS